MFDYQEEMDQYLEEIEELARSKQYTELRELFLPMEPADIALLLEKSGEKLMPLLYRLLPKETAAEVFVELESDSQEMLINGFSNTELQEVLDELYLDDAVDIVEEMPASVVIRILDRATPEMRKSINEILKYPEDSAGSIMNMEFLSLKKDMTVEDAFKRIRRIGGDMETINILYVTDPTRHLLGVLSVRDLLLAEEDDLIEEIMDPDVVWRPRPAHRRHGAAAGRHRHRRRRNGRHRGGDDGGLREDGRYAPLGQALSQGRRLRHMEGPPAVADDPDALGDVHGDDPQPL